jgi:hypothetical protein
MKKLFPHLGATGLPQKWEISGKKAGKIAFMAFNINIINMLKKLQFFPKNCF